MEKQAPELALLYHCPNGADRHPAVAAKLKKQGMNLAQKMDALYAKLGYHEAKVISIELKGPNAMETSPFFLSLL